MINLLFPGRHLLNTKFQEKYLSNILTHDVSDLPLLNKRDWPKGARVTNIVFTITSANQENSRYNPLPFYIRAIGVDRFVGQFRKLMGISYQIIGIPHFDKNEHFAEFILKLAGEATDCILYLRPENPIVVSSTPFIIDMYKKLGFSVLPAEFIPETGAYLARTPIEIFKSVVNIGSNWGSNATLREEISSATFSLWHDSPYIVKRILRLWRDPLLTEEGGLTETRNYNTYAFGMANEIMLNVKYDEIKPFIVPGKIADEGCADGALDGKIAKDFPDSDIIGIEITGEFVARFKERQRAGGFGGTFVHVHQRNLMDKIFDDGSIDTTICNATPHEIWSYGGGEATLRDYLDRKFAQTRPHGRIIIRDVVGPEDKDGVVYMWLNDKDGASDGELGTLSTYAKFLRFAEDYLADMRSSGRRGDDTKIKYKEDVVLGKRYIILRLKDAVEFITKKDYVDNWRSELNEEFAFWSFSEWIAALTRAGFSVLENPNEPLSSSRIYTSEWIIKNGLAGKVELFIKNSSDQLLPLPYPPTTMILIGEKK